MPTADHISSSNSSSISSSSSNSSSIDPEFQRLCLALFDPSLHTDPHTLATAKLVLNKLCSNIDPDPSHFSFSNHSHHHQRQQHQLIQQQQQPQLLPEQQQSQQQQQQQQLLLYHQSLSKILNNHFKNTNSCSPYLSSLDTSHFTHQRNLIRKNLHASWELEARERLRTQLLAAFAGSSSTEHVEDKVVVQNMPHPQPPHSQLQAQFKTDRRSIDLTLDWMDTVDQDQNRVAAAPLLLGLIRFAKVQLQLSTSTTTTADTVSLSVQAPATATPPKLVWQVPMSHFKMLSEQLQAKTINTFASIFSLHNLNQLQVQVQVQVQAQAQAQAHPQSPPDTSNTLDSTSFQWRDSLPDDVLQAVLNRPLTAQLKELQGMCVPAGQLLLLYRCGDDDNQQQQQQVTVLVVAQDDQVQDKDRRLTINSGWLWWERCLAAIWNHCLRLVSWATNLPGTSKHSKGGS